MKYELLKEDTSSFHMRHPDGSTFRVAKKGLDEVMHDRIRKLQAVQHYAEGGEVEAPPERMALPESSQAVAAEDAGMNPDVAPVPPVAAAEKGLGPEPAMGPSPAEVVAGKPADSSGGMPELSENVSSSMKPFNPAQPEMPAMPGGMGRDPFSLQEKGVKEEAAAQKVLGEESAKAYDQAESDFKAAKTKFDDQLNKEQARTDALIQGLETKKIDPDRLLNNMSTGNKILAGIGLILGGLGGVQSAAMVLDKMNRSIDRDIDAQKADINNQNNLVSLHFQNTHNLQQAGLMAKNDVLSAVEFKVKKLAAQASSPMAQARADQLLGQIAQQRQQNNLSLAETALKLRVGAGGVNANEINTEFLPKDVRERVVRIPGGGIGLANSEDDAKEAKKTLTSLQQIDSNIDRALKFMKETGPTFGGAVHVPGVGDVGYRSAQDAKAESIRNSIILELNKLHDLNRLNDNEFKTFKTMVASPGSLRQDKALALFMNLRDFVKEKRDAELQNRLSNYQPPRITSERAGFSPVAFRK